MPRRSSLVALATVLAIVLGVVLQPLTGHVTAVQGDALSATRIPRAPTVRATFRVSLPPVATFRVTPRASASASASAQPSYEPSPSASASASALPVYARPDVYDEVVFDVPDPLGNVTDNDDLGRCRASPSSLTVISTEPPSYPVSIDSAGNVRLRTTQPGQWVLRYRLSCAAEPVQSYGTDASVTVTLRQTAPTPTATPRTPTPRPIPTIRLPTSTPRPGVTPAPTRIIRFTATPIASQRPTVRPIGTVRPPRPTATPTRRL